MKRVKSEIERKGDQTKVKALFRTKWKKPGHVEIVLKAQDDPSLGTVIEGDSKEINDVLGALAEIAWDNGWRPPGLVPMMAHLISNFKMVKPE